MKSEEEKFLDLLLAAGVKPVVEGDRVLIYNPAAMSPAMMVKMASLDQEKFCQAVAKREGK